MPSRCQAEYSSALLIHKLFLPCALPFSRSNTATCRALSRCIHHHHRLVIASSLAHVGEIFPTPAGRTVRGIGVGGAIPVHCTVLTRAASTNRSCEGACRSWIPPMDECDLYLTHVKAFEFFETRFRKRNTIRTLQVRYTRIILRACVTTHHATRSCGWIDKVAWSGWFGFQASQVLFHYLHESFRPKRLKR